MIHIWQQLIDFLFPPSDSLLVLRQYATVPYTQYYEPHQAEGAVALSHYQSPLIKASITAGKFEHNIAALESLGVLLRTYLLEHQNTHPASSTVFVPIPLHYRRQHERGYNQVDIILDSALKGSAYRSAPLLKRTINTSPQSHLKRKDRLDHLKDAFTYKPTTISWETVTNVIIIDDVITTGSTLEAARSALAPHLPPGITLYTLAIAH